MCCTKGFFRTIFRSLHFDDPPLKPVNLVRNKNLPVTCVQPLMDSGGDVTDQPYEAAIAAFGALIAGFCVRGCSIFYSYEFT